MAGPGRRAGAALALACTLVLDAQAAFAETLTCKIDATCSGRILGANCDETPPSVVTFVFQPEDVFARIERSGGPVRVEHYPHDREWVFVERLPEGSGAATMEYAIDKTALTLLAVPDWSDATADPEARHRMGTCAAGDALSMLDRNRGAAA